LRLNLATYAMECLRTDGWSPPWLQGQRAMVDDTAGIDLRVGMKFIDGDHPEVHLNGVPFGLLVNRDDETEMADNVPEGDDAEVCEHNIESLSERFRACYNPVQKLEPGMRFEFEDNPDNFKVRVLAESGELLGYLCEAFDQCRLPLKMINDEADMRRAADILKDNIVEPPDYILRNEDAVEDVEASDLFIAKAPASTVLGTKPEGLMQKVFGGQWQSVHVGGRNVAVHLYKGSYTSEYQECLFNLDTLAWSNKK